MEFSLAAPQEQEPFGTVDTTLADNKLGAKQRGFGSS